MSGFICKNCQALLGVGNVYCLNCGTPVGASVDEGEQVTIVRPAAIPPKKGDLSTSKFVGVVAALLIAGATFAGFLIWSKYQDDLAKRQQEAEARNRANATQSTADAKRNAAVQTPWPPATPAKQIVKVLNEVRTIGAGDVFAIPFTLPTNGMVKGGFRTTAGGDKDIDAYVLDETNYALLISRQGFKSFVTRPKAERGRLDASLGPGNYFVVFSNRHAMLTQKEIAAEIDLEY